MALQLTEEQRQAHAAGNGGPVQLLDPTTNTYYVLIRADLFQASQPGQALPRPADNEDLWEGVAPGIRRSHEAFLRDLPKLMEMQSRKRQWVAYQGDKQIGFGRTQREAAEKCLKLGLKPDEFLVEWIGPPPPDEIDIGELMGH
jgi:hypothetical protein